MWNYLKQIFAEPLATVTFTKTVTADDSDFGVSQDGLARLRQMKNGKYRLLVNQNEVVGTYARKRDAIRGAERKGLTVVEA